MQGPPGERLREAGGSDFVTRMNSLYFDLCSNRAQNHIKAMGDNFRDPDLVQACGGSFLHALNAARDPDDLFLLLSGATWTPSDQQLTKLLYRMAVGYRVLGQLAQAEISIEKALAIVPDDGELEKEKKRIFQCRMGR